MKVWNSDMVYIFCLSLSQKIHMFKIILLILLSFSITLNYLKMYN